MPGFTIKDLELADIHNDAVLKLDQQFYPEHLLWSKDMWLEIYEAAFFKKAVYTADTQQMIGNMLVIVNEDRRTEYTTECLQIWSATIDKNYHRQGLAKRLFSELSAEIATAKLKGDLANVDCLDLSTENPHMYDLVTKAGFIEYWSDAESSDNKHYFYQSTQDFQKNVIKLFKPRESLKFR